MKKFKVLLVKSVFSENIVSIYNSLPTNDKLYMLKEIRKKRLSYDEYFLLYLASFNSTIDEGSLSTENITCFILGEKIKYEISDLLNFYDEKKINKMYKSIYKKTEDLPSFIQVYLVLLLLSLDLNNLKNELKNNLLFCGE